MNIKRIGLVIILLVALGAGSVFAHDKGDLVLNIEPMAGLALGQIGIFVNGMDISKMPGANYVDEWDFTGGLYGTLHYYFTSFLGINSGVGVNGRIFMSSFSEYGSGPTTDIIFGNFYTSVPVGIRLSLSVLALGGGVTANIPIIGLANYSIPGSYNAQYDRDTKYKADFYLGWYADIGFDMSGIKGRDKGFGLLLRLEGCLSDQIAGTTWQNAGNTFEYKPFHFYSASLVFQFANDLGHYPIGGE